MMFNNLKLIKGSERARSNYSFVGIKKNLDTQLFEFWLPHGFENFPDNDFNQKKQLFFNLYKTFRKFYCENINLFLNESIKQTTDRDGAQIGRNGQKLIEPETDESIILYSKISLLDAILDSFDELKIHSIIQKEKHVEKINFSKIDKYLHLSTFLENDTLYIEQMNLPSNIKERNTTLLVKMYCFIFREIKKELNEFNEISELVLNLADQFQELFVPFTKELFDEFEYENTIAILKSVLIEIDQSVFYKDLDYYDFFYAIEDFLYNTNLCQDEKSGIFWGINNFSAIWESMCVEYAFYEESIRKNIMFADTCKNSSIRIGNHLVFANSGFQNIFQLSMNNTTTRYLRPDLVLARSPIVSTTERVEDILEFKYNPEIKYTNSKSKGKKRKTMQDWLGSFSLKLKNAHREEVFVSAISVVEEIAKRKITTKHYAGNFHIELKDFLKSTFEKIKSIIYKLSKQQNVFIIIDYKYMPLEMFYVESDKLHEICEKQLIYEIALQSHYPKHEITNRFFVPYYFEKTNNDDSDDGDVDIDSNFCEAFNKYGIEVYKGNFTQMQHRYIQTKGVQRD